MNTSRFLVGHLSIAFVLNAFAKKTDRLSRQPLSLVQTSTSQVTARRLPTWKVFLQSVPWIQIGCLPLQSPGRQVIQLAWSTFRVTAGCIGKGRPRSEEVSRAFRAQIRSYTSTARARRFFPVSITCRTSSPGFGDRRMAASAGTPLRRCLEALKTASISGSTEPSGLIRAEYISRERLGLSRYSKA